jgi:hypothetical protein
MCIPCGRDVYTKPLASNNGGIYCTQESRLTEELLEVVFLLGSEPSYIKSLIVSITCCVVEVYINLTVYTTKYL